MRPNHLIYLLSVLSCFQTYSQELSGFYDTEDFSIKYPDTWSLAENEMGAKLFILAPKSDQSDEFNEYVNLVVQDLEGTNLDLDSYVALSKEQIEKRVTNVTISRNERLKSGSLELHKLVYSGEINGLGLKLIQHFRVKDQKAYVITFTAEESDFDLYRRHGQSTLNSFRLK